MKSVTFFYERHSLAFLSPRPPAPDARDLEAYKCDAAIAFSEGAREFPAITILNPAIDAGVLVNQHTIHRQRQQNNDNDKGVQKILVEKKSKLPWDRAKTPPLPGRHLWGVLLGFRKIGVSGATFHNPRISKKKCGSNVSVFFCVSGPSNHYDGGEGLLEFCPTAILGITGVGETIV